MNCASRTLPCNKACNARCNPQPGHCNPVTTLNGHFGAQKEVTGLYK